MTYRGCNIFIMKNIPGFQQQINPSSLPVKNASLFSSKTEALTMAFRTALSEKSENGFNFCFFDDRIRRQGRLGQEEPPTT